MAKKPVKRAFTEIADLNAGRPTVRQTGWNTRPDGKGGWIVETITRDSPVRDIRSIHIPFNRSNQWTYVSIMLLDAFYSLCGGAKAIEKLLYHVDADAERIPQPPPTAQPVCIGSAIEEKRRLEQGGQPAKPSRAPTRHATEGKYRFTREALALLHRPDRLEKKDLQRAFLKKVPSVLRQADRKALEAEGFSDEDVHRGMFMDVVLFGRTPEAQSRGRRYFQSPTDPEVAKAEPLLWRLVPLIRQVLDDYATIRNLSEAERTNLTLRDLQGHPGDVEKLKRKYGARLGQEYPRPVESEDRKSNYQGVWHDAIENLARLWNWKPGPIEEDELQLKLGNKKLGTVDLYSHPLGTTIDEDSSIARPDPRWKRLPLMCEWCGTPVIGCQCDPVTNIPARVCSKKCSQKKCKSVR